MTQKVKLMTIGIVALVIGSTSGYFLNHALAAPAHAETSSACSGTHATYQISIKDDIASPAHIDAKLCDTIAFINRGDTRVLIAFGEHEDHTSYDGIGERRLNKGEGFTITANQTGAIKFHDHIHDKVTGDINIAQ